MFYLSKWSQVLVFPAFRWFLLNRLMASFGEGLAYIIITWLALVEQGSITAVAIIMLCYWSPTVLLSPIAGVWADRLNRRNIILIVSSCRAVALIAFLVIYHQYPSLILLYGFALGLGLFQALYLPAAMAIVRELVTPEKLLYANALSDNAYEMGNILGMGLAGLCVAWMSTTGALWVPNACFLIAAIAMLAVHYKPRAHTVSQKRAIHWGNELRSGLKYLTERKRLCMVYSAQLLVMVAYMTAPVLLAPFAKEILHADVAEFGQLEAALSIGIVVGGFATPLLAERFGTRWVLFGEVAIMALSFGWFCHTENVLTADVLYAIIGFCFSSWVLIVTRGQELTDIDFQGRVQSTFNSLSGMVILALYLFISIIGSAISVKTLYFIEIALALLAATLIWHSRKAYPLRKEQEK